jgi:hypothetical protein
MAAFNVRLLHTCIVGMAMLGGTACVQVPAPGAPAPVGPPPSAPATRPPATSAPATSPPATSPPAPTAPAPSAAAQGTTPAQGSGFSKEQLDQMLAPIALYPDSLLSQVLMAATYPADVAEAAKWSKANPTMKGDEATKAVQSQPWDPAVQAMVAFPQVIQMMGDKPDWTQNLGDAFLASPKDVLDSAQRLRARAQQAGNLKSSEQQKVVVEQAPPQPTVIRIEPANPEVVYVPSYNPTVVYGAWPYPAYPPFYYPPSPYYYPYYPGAALATGIAWGIGFAAVGSLWGNCNWGGGDVNINVERFNNINTNRKLERNQNNFRHNAENRRGVPYRDARSQQQFGRQSGDATQRTNYRGRDAAGGGRDAQRAQAQSMMQQRGISQGDGAGARAGGTRAQAGSGNAFQGARDPGQARQQMDRGTASRQSFSQQQFSGGGGARASSGGYSGGARASGGGFSGGGRAGGGGRGGGGGRR